MLLLHNNKLCGDIPLSLVNLNKIKTSDPEKIAWFKKESDWAKNLKPCQEIIEFADNADEWSTTTLVSIATGSAIVIGLLVLFLL